MGKKFITATVFVLLVLSLPALFRKRAVPIVANGKVVALGKRPFVMPWRDNEFSVYAKDSKVFSLWGDLFDFPLFIHAFADGKRFLCIDDDDTAVLVFVVDLGTTITNTANSFGWPPDEYTRNHLARRATNIIIETKGQVRLPSFSEVQEVSSNLANLNPRQLKAASYPCADFGVYRFYCPKETLLNALDTNRHSVWP